MMRLPPDAAERHIQNLADADHAIIHLALALQMIAFPERKYAPTAPAPLYLNQATALRKNVDARTRLIALINALPEDHQPVEG